MSRTRQNAVWGSQSLLSLVAISQIRRGSQKQVVVNETMAKTKKQKKNRLLNPGTSGHQSEGHSGKIDGYFLLFTCISLSFSGLLAGADAHRMTLPQLLQCQTDVSFWNQNTSASDHRL